MHCAAKQGKKPRTLQRVKNTRAWTDDQFNTFSCFFSTTLVYLFLPPSTLGFTWVSAFRLQHNKRLVLSPPNTSRSELYSFHRRSETLIDQTESEFDTAKRGEVSQTGSKTETSPRSARLYRPTARTTHYFISPASEEFKFCFSGDFPFSLYSLSFFSGHAPSRYTPTARMSLIFFALALALASELIPFL